MIPPISNGHHSYSSNGECAYSEAILTRTETQAIQELIPQLVLLLPNRDHVESVGAQLRSAHPLRVCTFICNDKNLCKALYTVSQMIDPGVVLGGQTRWGQFIDEFARHIQDKQRTIRDDLPNFAKDVGIAHDQIRPYFFHSNGNWRGERGNMQALWFRLFQHKGADQ